MNRATILDTYQVNDSGLITSPGKFESEMIYVPYFYDLSLDGGPTTIILGFDDYQKYDAFEIDADDRREFPEIGADVAWIVLFERESGFVDATEYTEDGYQEFLRELETAIDDESEDEDPTEPAEGDLTTEDHHRFAQDGAIVLAGPDRNGWWSFKATDSKAFSSLGRFGEDHVAAINAYMVKTQFFPNCWFISDHGNAHLMDLSVSVSDSPDSPSSDRSKGAKS